MHIPHLGVLAGSVTNAVVRRCCVPPWLLVGVAVLALGVEDLGRLVDAGSGVGQDTLGSQHLGFGVAGFAGELTLGLAALLMLRERGHRMDRSGWVDAILAAYGAAAVGLAAASPGPEEVYSGGPLQLGHLIVGMTVGLVMIQAVVQGGWRDQVVVWLALAIGARQAVNLGAVVGERRNGAASYLVDGRAAWVVFAGCLMLAAWHDGRLRPRRTPVGAAGEAQGGWVIPAFCMVGAVGVLVWGQSHDVPRAATALAAVTLASAIVRAATKSRQLERLGVLGAMAPTDELSGLLNRRGFTAELERAVAAGPGALLVIDVDRFRDVNQLLGHGAADDLLAQLGSRLRAFANGGEVLGRLGADEFALIITARSGSAALAAARRIHSLIGDPFEVRGDELRVDVTVGVSTWVDGSSDVDALMDQAMAAIGHARERGLPAERWDSERDALAVRRLALADSLRRSVGREELTLHYQPKVDVISGVVVGVEALARWDNDGESIPPDIFIALAEEGGLIGDLTTSLLGKALAQQRVWCELGHDLVMAVNLSPRNLADPSLPQRVASLLDQHAVPPERLLLEITETTLMPDPGRCGRVLERLRRAGVRVSIDDYGTGHAALGYLRSFSVDELKLDRSYVTAMIDDPRTAAIVRSTIEMGRQLGLEVVAEGVENQQQVDALVAAGCTVLQGYLMCRPLPPAQLMEWLVGRRA